VETSLQFEDHARTLRRQQCAQKAVANRNKGADAKKYRKKDNDKMHSYRHTFLVIGIRWTP